jgi:hypothetical protein
VLALAGLAVAAAAAVGVASAIRPLAAARGGPQAAAARQPDVDHSSAFG